MESVKRTPGPSLSTASSYGSCRAAAAAAEPEQFPAGLRVLVVDDDVVCLRILEQMLQRCQYRVTTCCQATIALSLLRERKDDYDVVISDVHMPDMDGFKLLELVGLEMDLPVIMMSADGRTSIVLKGIKHGACDYLIKPVRIEELKNIWQHVVRKKRSENKEPEHSGSFDDSDRHPRAVDDTDYASSVIEGTDGSRKSQRKRRDAKEEEDDGELDSEDPSASKKARVVWSVELHQQFVSAVNQLGIDKAVPKRILELMNVPGLTRENVASHLQKFRMYLKRLSGVAQHQNGLPNSFFVHMEPNAKMGSLGSADFQALVASGQIPPQTLAALHAELLGIPSGSLILPEMDQTAPIQAFIHGPRSTPMEAGVDFGQYQSNKTEQLHLSNIAFDGISSGFSVCSSGHLGTLKSMRNLGGVGDTQNDNMLVRLLPQQQALPVLSESHNAVNVQPSCVVVSPQSSGNFQLGNSRFPLNQNSRTMLPHLAMDFQKGTTSIPQNSKCNNGRVVSYSSHSLESNGILGIGQVSDGGFKNFGVLNGHTSPGSLSSPLSLCSSRNGRSTGLMAHNSIMNPGSVSKLPGDSSNLCILDSEANIAQGHGRNLGFVGKATCISSRFAVDDIPSNNLSNKMARVHEDAERVKQELYFDFKDVSNFSSSVLPHFSANDVTGVLSKY